jgi:hypothetical protein
MDPAGSSFRLIRARRIAMLFRRQVTMHDEYRWTDHLISTRRLRFDLIATLLILAAAGGASLAAGDEGNHPPGYVASAPSSERPPHLTVICKRQILAKHHSNG